MPIYLTVDDYNPKGPDGQGRNRLRVDGLEPLPRCALKPRTYSALRECQDTRRAQWAGHYDYCTNGGDCENCPVFKGKLADHIPASFAEDLYIRELPRSGREDDGSPQAMNKPDKGFAEYGKWGFSWADVLHCPIRFIAEFGRDEHSRYVILRRKKETGGQKGG